MAETDTLQPSEFLIDYPVDPDLRDRLVMDAYPPGATELDLSNFSFLQPNAVDGVCIKLPFQNSVDHGMWDQHTNFFDAYKQHMDVLFNTLPEERVVTGKGSTIKTMLFEQRTPEWELNLKNEIRNVIAMYMPNLKVDMVEIHNAMQMHKP